MSTKEIIFVFILVFLGGFVASRLIEADMAATSSIPFLVMVGAFLGIIFNRIKHIDDLNLSRKKDVSLGFVEAMSDYSSVLVSLVDQNTTMDIFHKNLNEATKKMNSELNKFHVVCSQALGYALKANELELLNFKIVSLMLIMVQESAKVGEDKVVLIKKFLSEDVFSKLNIIRFKVINLVNREIGDGSGTVMFKQAIEKNNIDYKKMLSKVID